MSDWDILTDYFRTKNPGDIFKTSDLNADLRDVNSRWMYISLLKKAKFITKVCRATWQLAEPLPQGLTTGSIQAFLNGDNLSYIEFIQRKREKDALFIPYNEDRKFVLQGLINAGLECLKFVQNSNYMLHRLSTSYLRYQINEWKRELKRKNLSPTKRWMESKIVQASEVKNNG